jgi:hypothetical protein
MNIYQIIWAVLYAISLVAWIIVMWWPDVPAGYFPLFSVVFVADLLLTLALVIIYVVRDSRCVGTRC